ncbi:pectin esterase [Clostridium estertheticum]|uniref:pectinesterase family protein n=1 Tax=Clostridium estertheticum TaxID=238834 RepID=UPI001C0C0A9E|nr:pectinesterase family protein [Clostridium estertheticum]MBU3178676.1 pectin esterase [Clostridium estertheticum]
MKKRIFTSILMLFALFILFVPSSASAYAANITVSKDGTGDYKTIKAALDSIPANNSSEKIIFVKNGIYEEQVTISKPFITIIGESKQNTILTYHTANGDSKPNGGTYGSADCAALTVAANDFNAQNITFENSHLKTTGKDVQASCVYTYGDRLTFTNCNFYSGQDTVCAYSYGVNKSRVYFKNCFIQGSVDFIWGGASALFDTCTLNNIRDGGMYTAANTPNGQQFGYAFLNCTLTAKADPNYTSHTNPRWGTPSTVYLGRTYGDYCHVSYINCTLAAPINPLGWLKMGNDVNNTALLEESGCKGIGANRSKRVNWSQVLTDRNAAKYTISNVLSGNDGWKP